jgi:hypothetical protein
MENLPTRSNGKYYHPLQLLGGFAKVKRERTHKWIYLGKMNKKISALADWI